MKTFPAKLFPTALALVLALVLPVSAQEKEAERLSEAGEVLGEILNIPEGIPKDLLHKAECVVVFPSVKKAAIGIGGSYGRGAMSCRTGEGYNGPWGPPTMMALEGFNIGFQLGGQATDFVLLIMNKKGGESILSNKVKLGADAAAVAGPKGRDAQAATDAVMKAEVLSYSRSKGLFAGVSLEGSTLRPDNKANEKIYGKTLTAKSIVRGQAKTPAAAAKLVATLQKASPRNLSK